MNRVRQELRTMFDCPGADVVLVPGDAPPTFVGWGAHYRKEASVVHYYLPHYALVVSVGWLRWHQPKLWARVAALILDGNKVITQSYGVTSNQGTFLVGGAP